MSTHKFRFSVTRKVAVGLALIIAIGMISMLFIYRGLDEVERALEQLAAVEAPLNAAAYELELNVNGMGLAVLKYLATRTPEYRAWAENDEQDFAHYHAEYLRLARTEEERDLALRVGKAQAALQGNQNRDGHYGLRGLGHPDRHPAPAHRPGGERGRRRPGPPGYSGISSQAGGLRKALAVYRSNATDRENTPKKRLDRLNYLSLNKAEALVLAGESFGLRRAW